MFPGQQSNSGVVTKTIYSGSVGSTRKCMECGMINSKMAKKCQHCKSPVQVCTCTIMVCTCDFVIVYVCMYILLYTLYCVCISRDVLVLVVHVQIITIVQNVINVVLHYHLQLQNGSWEIKVIK